MEAKKLLEKLSLLNSAVYSYICILNQLGYLNAEWTNSDFAESYLKEAKDVYLNYKALNDPLVPLNGLALFKQAHFGSASDSSTFADEHNLWAKFENLHTMSLYFLAQVYRVCTSNFYNLLA